MMSQSETGDTVQEDKVTIGKEAKKPEKFAGLGEGHYAECYPG